MRDARSPEDVPISPVYRGLIAHYQRCNQPGLLTVFYAGQHRVTYRLAQLRYREQHSPAQALGRHVFGSGTDVAGSLNALVPKPQLIVKPVGVTRAMRGFKTQCELPALPRQHSRWHAIEHSRWRCGKFCAERHCGPGHKGTPVPAYIHQRGHTHRYAIQGCCLDLQTKAHGCLVALGQIGHHTGNHHIAPFQHRIDCVG